MAILAKIETKNIFLKFEIVDLFHLCFYQMGRGKFLFETQRKEKSLIVDSIEKDFLFDYSFLKNRLSKKNPKNLKIIF
jgi:hypothetical protein